MTNSSEEQLKNWVAGKSIHNKERNECCPDFSCCHPTYSASMQDRKIFQEANEATRFKMLGKFLGEAMADYSNKKVHVAGQDGNPFIDKN